MQFKTIMLDNALQKIKYTTNILVHQGILYVTFLSAPPRLSIALDMQRISVPPGKDVTLECTVTGNPLTAPEVQYYWERNNTEIVQDDKYTTG